MLLDKPFVIFTNNKPLVNSFANPSENHSPRQVRQLSYLSQFDCTVTFNICQAEKIYCLIAYPELL